jgi:hypothetical protein
MDEAIKNLMELLCDLKYFRMLNPIYTKDVEGGDSNDDGMESNIIDPMDKTDAEAIEENLVVQ